MNAAPRRILLIQHHHLGDVILTTPAIRAARQHFPDARIEFVTSQLGAHALQDNPHLDAVVTQPRLFDIYRRKFDAVIDMHSVPRTARIVAASRARLRVGLRGRGPRNLAYTMLLPREKGSVYMARQKLRLLAPLGVDVERADLALELALRSEHHERAAEFAAAHGFGQHVAAISPVAKHAFKQWGASNWARVADALAANGMQILITSGPGEREQAAAVASQMKQPSVWELDAGGIQDLAALYARCTLWLGNDGGPKHIATAAGTPTVTIYRRNLGGVWSDPADPKQVVVNSGAESLEGVHPETVVNSALQLVRGMRAARSE